ncbi:MAG: alpha/beta hydrolase [Campylobacterota bacterium]
MKKIIFFIAIMLFSVNAFSMTKENCEQKDGSFIFNGGECLEYAIAGSQNSEEITIVVHGVWDKGTNVLGRYSVFADNLNFITDITTIAVALPGYSNSTTNNFLALDNEKIEHLAAKREYVDFVASLIKSLKQKHGAKKVNYIGHSAGAMIGATIAGLNPDLIDNLVLAGGRYDIHEISDEKDLISVVDVIDKIDDTKFLLIYGTDDEISQPEVTTNFYELAKQKGLDVDILEVDGAKHIDLEMKDKSVDAIADLLY